MVALAALALSIPLHFEAIRGEPGRAERFSAVTPRYNLILSDRNIAMRFHGGALLLKIPRTRPRGVDELPAKSNYYFGPRPDAWRTAVPNFARVRYANVFRGVDLVIYGRDREIEYDWIVAPGADPRSIRFSVEGASVLKIDSGGDLVLQTAAGPIRHSHPRIYQGAREIAGRFLLRGREVRFEVGDYDRRKPLVIDPVLVVNASFGGSGIQINFVGVHGSAGDTGTGIATDPAGNIYVTGTTFSTNFPLVNSLPAGPPQACQLNCDFRSIFVTKLSPDGATLLYSTYIGAPAMVRPAYVIPPLLPASIAVDANGTAYVTGRTSGENFPGVTATSGGDDAFLLRLDSQGALIGTRLFGGNGEDAGTSIVLGTDGALYLAGTTESSDFPVTQGAYRAPAPGTSNIFVVKIAFNALFGAPGGNVVYSSVLGPGGSASVAADASGSAYIAAATSSAAWQTTAGVVQPACAGDPCGDVVLARLDPPGRRLLYATYLGGSRLDLPGGIAVDAAGNLYVAGSTSSFDFPVSSGAFQVHAAPSSYTGFAAKLSPDASKLLYSTYLGGTGGGQAYAIGDQAYAIAVDGTSNAYIGGSTSSADFPLRFPVQSTMVNAFCPIYTPSGTIPHAMSPCGSAGFLAELDSTGASLLWSTYVGAGSVRALLAGAAGDIYAAGEGIAVNPTTTDNKVGVLKFAPGNPALDIPANPIVNGASFVPGLPLPGGLASVFVRGLNLTAPVIAAGSPLPTELAGVSILVGGLAAPILAVAPVDSGMEQINFQVPFEAASNAVEIRYRGSSVFAFPQQGGPGIFLLSDGSPAIQHAADYSLVTPSNPAHPGEAIIVYSTGLGKVTPAVLSGVPASGPAPVALSCGGLYAATDQAPWGTVLYAGLAPGYVGLYQVNLRLPEMLPSGTVEFTLNNSVCDGFPYGLTSNKVSVPVQ